MRRSPICNAKDEFVKFVETRKVKCSKILRVSDHPGVDCKVFVLKVDHTVDEYLAFLNLLDFRYDNGYGSQELEGDIWFEDGTWAERCEYDGAEWWEYRVLPEIPKECQR